MGPHSSHLEQLDTARKVSLTFYFGMALVCVMSIA